MFCKDEHGGPPPCAATCPRDYHPTCDEFRGMIAPGGCGSTCSDELKREYEAMLCPAAPPPPPPHHGPPPCAMTCPTHMPTCAEFHQFVGPGGCASTCPDDLKTEGHVMFCEGEHGGPPPCAATCPRHHPSCDEFRGMIAPGGCGSTCSDELKREYE